MGLFVVLSLHGVVYPGDCVYTSYGDNPLSVAPPPTELNHHAPSSPEGLYIKVNKSLRVPKVFA